MAKPAQAAQYRPELLMSVHGIRTRGTWQKEVFPVFGRHVEDIESFDYGRYGLLKFLTPPMNRKMVDQFYEWYGNKVAAARGVDLARHDKRPSCLAHSFGTWIVGKAMLKHADVKFDKLVFSGSVLPRDFDWDRLIARDQVGSVHNECGGRDFWPSVAAHLVAGAGDAGSHGFDRHDSVVYDHMRPDFAHSDPLYKQHMQNVWRPFVLRRPSPLYVLVGRSVDEAETEFDAVLGQCRAIDNEIYGSQPSWDILKLPEGRSQTWVSINPDIYTFLMDKSSGQAAGYINAMPVTDEVYQRLRDGTLRDKDVTADDIEPYLTPGTVKMYLMSVAVRQPYRKWGEGLFHRGMIQLFAATIEKLIHYLSTTGIKVSHFLAVTWTPEGRKICKSLGMKIIGKDPDGHEIYEVEFEPMVRGKATAPRLLNRLIKAYRAMDIGGAGR